MACPHRVLSGGLGQYVLATGSLKEQGVISALFWGIGETGNTPNVGGGGLAGFLVRSQRPGWGHAPEEVASRTEGCPPECPHGHQYFEGWGRRPGPPQERRPHTLLASRDEG